MTQIRIGRGTDRHLFLEGRPLILGGIDIPHSKGLKGHSDADALLHALSDALLGSLALGDIGQHFPDTDATHKDLDSKIILQHCLEMIQKEGWSLVNCDIVIHTQLPKIGPHRLVLRESLASLLGCEVGQGYYWSEPIDMEAFILMMKAQPFLLSSKS